LKPEPIAWCAPVNGFYSIRASMTRIIHTGKFETVRNPDRRWWSFWKPKFITREIVKYEHLNPIDKTVYLKKGDKVVPSVGP